MRLCANFMEIWKDVEIVTDLSLSLNASIFLSMFWQYMQINSIKLLALDHYFLLIFCAYYSSTKIRFCCCSSIFYIFVLPWFISQWHFPVSEQKNLVRVDGRGELKIGGVSEWFYKRRIPALRWPMERTNGTVDWRGEGSTLKEIFRLWNNF